MKERVTLENEGQTIVANLYLPDSYRQGDKLPAVVVTGAWTSVKEQMAGTYAMELADKGFAAIAFDFRGWGESVGGVPFLEDPTRKTEDINAVVNYLTTRSEVDADRIAGLGICASAGYMSDAALENSNVKTLALVAPWLHNGEIVNQVYGGQAGVNALIENGRVARQAAEAVIIEAASMTNKKALMYQAPYYTETERGLIPEYDNKFNVASWEGWLTYDAIQTADELKKPTLIVHSESAAIPQGAKEYIHRMGNYATAIWLGDFTQFDFYDKPAAVNASVVAVVKHFDSSL